MLARIWRWYENRWLDFAEYVQTYLEELFLHATGTLWTTQREINSGYFWINPNFDYN